jgi:hypothetical protein
MGQSTNNFMVERKKPQTKQELEADSANHPERGKVDGKPVVSDAPRELRGCVPAELKRNSAGVQQALTLYWNENREAVESHERQKSEELGISVAEVQKKSYGHSKARSRQKKLNLMGGDNE